MKYAAVIGLAALGAISASSASAETYIVRQVVSPNIACYDRVYVPARVLVNTRGRLVRGESKVWVTSPGRWDYVRNAATYIQTRKVVEADHYTLVRRGC